MQGSTPPPLPTDTTPSTATKVAFTAGAVALVAAPVVLPYSPKASALLVSLGGLGIAIGTIFHVYWDHSP